MKVSSCVSHSDTTYWTIFKIASMCIKISFIANVKPVIKSSQIATDSLLFYKFSYLPFFLYHVLRDACVYTQFYLLKKICTFLFGRDRKKEVVSCDVNNLENQASDSIVRPLCSSEIYLNCLCLELMLTFTFS